MRWLLLVFAVVMVSCSKNGKKYFTADLDFTCTPVGYFDTLQTFLLTNDKSDLGGEQSGIERFFSASRVYHKNVVRRNGHFYVDSIENREYWLLLLECKFVGGEFSGSRHNLDFSDNRSDTVRVTVCVEPNVQLLDQQ